jgi:hypothetical protein
MLDSLQQAAAALGAQAQDDRAGELDGRGQIGGDRGLDLVVGQVFGRAEDAEAGVGDHHVDPSQPDCNAAAQVRLLHRPADGGAPGCAVRWLGHPL